MIADALAALRARRGRTLLAAVGVLAASLVVGTATTVGYSLATGFDRAAERADLPDVIARFDRQPRDQIESSVAALPNLETHSYRSERTNRELQIREHRTRKGAVNVVLGGRRGYAIVEGRDLRSGTTGEVVVERGLAREWDLEVGDGLTVEVARDTFERLRVAGIAVGPDNVAYPLASAARVYITERELQEARQFSDPVWPNVALLWLNDPAKADVTLTQARAVTFGVGRLQFITRTGVEILLSQAAGIVISLLVAFSLVALVAAGTMLAAAAHADVQRRLTGLGVQRALGFGPGRIAAQQATEAALLALPAAALGIALGALIVARPAAELLAALNELGPGAALAGPLALAARGRRGRRGRRGDVAGVARRAPPARRDPPRRRPGPLARALRRHRRPARPRRALLHRGPRPVARGGGDDRGLRRRRDADARARLAARAAAGGPGNGRQALPAGGHARLGAGARGRAAAGRGGGRRALQRRRRRLVPARRAGPARRLPRRSHALRVAAARRGTSDRRAG